MRIRVIFGLGNPGPKYSETRHNAGFLLVDDLAKRLPAPEGLDTGPLAFRHVRRFHAEILRTEMAYLVKPMTYMNESGLAVHEVCRFYRFSPEEILVVYDDLDLALGKLRFRRRGSAGGHNGIKSIIQLLGTDSFPRLKIGIGNEDRVPRVDVISHVLGEFLPEEKKTFAESLSRATDSVCLAIDEGLDAAMTRYN